MASKYHPSVDGDASPSEDVRNRGFPAGSGIWLIEPVVTLAPLDP